MRYSRALLPTLKEAPADATSKSHVLLLRGGYVRRVGARIAGRVVIDVDAASITDAVTGANETDYHFTLVQHGQDFSADTVEIRQIVDGDACPSCGASLKLFRGIEAGHIFLLGTHYTSKMSATYLDEKGDHQNIVMGCYGIGVSRLPGREVQGRGPDRHSSARDHWCARPQERTDRIQAPYRDRPEKSRALAASKRGTSHRPAGTESHRGDQGESELR